MGNFDFLAIPYLIDLTIAASAILINLFAQNLGATPFQLGLLGFSWGIVYSFASFISGRLADRGPRRLFLIFGLSIYGAVIIGYSFSGSVRDLIMLNLLSGLGSAFFWPVFETFLHEEADPGGTNRRMGFFNLGWTMGIISGSAVGGYLMAFGPRSVFRFLGGLIFLTLSYLSLRLRGCPAKVTSVGEEDMRKKVSLPDLRGRLKFLYVAWIANFVLFFSGAATSNMFPKVARVEGIPDGIIGVLLSLINVGQGITFFILSRTSIWHYRMTPIFAFEGVSLVGMLLLGFGGERSTYAFGMLLQGLGRGMTYASSLLYVLSATESKGANAGVHEMLVGSAFTLGPLLAGLVAQKIALKAAFHLASIVILLGWIAQASIILKFRGETSRP
ncbi:MFS transporter [Candidatus Poribacteria bacterium]|nr:MFS transporter [Candidatus Poribacteria bacterium]